MLDVSRYKSRAFEFPKHDIDPAKKDATWHRKYAEAIFSLHVRDYGAIHYSKRSDMLLNRLYGDARQPTTQYMDILCPKEQSTNKRKGFMNISWDNVSILPKFKALIVGMFSKIENDIVASATDEAADEERTALKWNLWAEKKLAAFLAEFPDELNLQANPDTTPVIPDSLQELEMFKEAGSFKLKDEIAIEAAIQDSFNKSDWEQTKDKIYEDLFEQGFVGVKDYVDPYTKEVRTKYIDVVDAVVAYSRSKTFDNIAHAGIINHLTIAQLRNEIKNSPRNEEINEAELKLIAVDYAGVNGNKQLYSYDYYSDSEHGGTTYPIDETRVDVLEFEMHSSDIEKFERRTNSAGESFLYPKEYSSNSVKTDRREPIQNELKMVYKGKWIIGTNYIYDWGQQLDVPREDPREPKLSFHFYKLSNKSMLQQVISMINDIQIAILKIRNASATAASKGLAIEFGALSNMSLGGQDMSPLDILTIRRRGGDLIFKATTHHSQINAGGTGGKPVTELEGGIGAMLGEQITIIDTNLNMIRDVLGISSITDGSTVNPKTGLGVAQLQQGATNNVLQNLYNGYKFLKESTARSMALRHQIVSRHKEINVHSKSLGTGLTQTIKIGSSIALRTLGIFLELRPSDESKALILQAALEARRASQQGAPGITMSDFMFIERQLENGRIKYAQTFLAFKEEKSKRELAQQARQNQVLQQQSLIIQEEEKRKTMVTKLQAEADRDIRVETAKSMLRREERNLAHGHSLEQLDKKGVNDVTGKIIKSEADKEISDSKNLSDETQALTPPPPTPVPAPASV